MTLKELLGTGNRKEQAERVAGLLQVASAPVIDVIVRFDGRVKSVVDVLVVGGSADFQSVYKILEQARQVLLAKEQAQVAQAKAQDEAAI